MDLELSDEQTLAERVGRDAADRDWPAPTRWAATRARRAVGARSSSSARWPSAATRGSARSSCAWSRGRSAPTWRRVPYLGSAAVRFAAPDGALRRFGAGRRRRVASRCSSRAAAGTRRRRRRRSRRPALSGRKVARRARRRRRSSSRSVAAAPTGPAWRSSPRDAAASTVRRAAGVRPDGADVRGRASTASRSSTEPRAPARRRRG